MAGLSEERLRVVAIIHALKAVGIRVKTWKNFLNGDSNAEQTLSQDSVSQRFAFGRNLHLLPQYQLSDMGGTVPQFLVEACEYLLQHLNTEGLFRKTGSLSRIRALRADLEQGKPVFDSPYAAHLQPCDVASLIKQFLRELPSPLIHTDLQNPLIQAQGLEMSHDQEGARNRTTLLITALFPSSNALTLRYLCTFLRQAAERCSENRMDVSSLAVVIVPNLLQCLTQPSKLTMDTEKHLEQQAAVIKSLILYADRIGVVPLCVLEASKATGKTETPSPTGGSMFSKRTELGVYRSLRRQRRRSVGEIFFDAFSKLKPCRTPTGPLISLDVMSDSPLSKRPTPQSPVTVKRKATRETVPKLQGSAKKRPSLHDLREDTQSSISQPTEESTSSHCQPEEKSIKEDTIPTTYKKRNQMREHRKSLRPSIQEEKVHQRKRSLRFISVTSGNNSSNASMTPANKDPENCSLQSAAVSLKIPFTLTDGPGGVFLKAQMTV
ncbi:rho GTPase-activating protein 11A-like [Myxocyprinus asiaticus]|uniref:rho GTPase-activating protein 11A-like n=1 Tax=Myxocyprinus asiaticus TaxID=70543 RepID=UPI0022220D16|nr:rho GTPase-activating protein 11A-like [Myxocyprinus asiaticus]